MMVYKIEISPTQEQKSIIFRTFDATRLVYNYFIEVNKARYENGYPYMGNMEFSKTFNNYMSRLEWVRDKSLKISSKAVKEAMKDADKAYQRFFKGLSRYPRFKSRRESRKSYYLCGSIHVKRHAVRLPNLGWVLLKEKNYIPADSGVISCRLIYEGGRFYVVILTQDDNSVNNQLSNDGLGVDVGIRFLATDSDKDVYPNINKSSRVKHLKKRLKREQRKLARRNKKSLRHEKTRQIINRIHYKISCICIDHKNKVVSALVKKKPSYITIETLNIKGMLKNRHLSRVIHEQGLHDFMTRLANKARQYGIELRRVSQYFASSKLCSTCGTKNDPKHKTFWVCTSCNTRHDRDINASLNLLNATQYAIDK